MATEGLEIRIGANVAQAVNGIKQVNNSLSQLQVQQKRAQGVQFAFSQSLRELPAFAFSAQTGILALSNNIPILIDNFKAARQSGLSFGSTLLQVGKSLFSFGGIATIAITALTVFGDKIFGAGKKSKDGADEIKSAFDVINEATDSVQGDIAKVNALVKAATDTGNSFKIQAAAIAELKKTNKEYFGDLVAGKSTYEQITTAANAYTQALISQAIVKGLQDEIAALAKQLREANKEYFKAAKEADFYNKELNKTKAAAGNQVKGLAAVNGSVVEAQTNADRYNKKLKESAAAVETLGNNMNELTAEIQKQIGIQLNFKPLSGADKDFKDQSDNIIARARQFVKEFGNTFVVPDLEESFTNTKKIILDKSKKLLEDVANKNLKIKIPVQAEITESDFIFDPSNVKLSSQQVDDIQKNFFKSLEHELGLDVPPITLPIDIKPEDKDADKKAKQFADGIRGVFADAFSSLGEDIGNAITGGGDLFSTLFQIVGAGVEALGKQIIALGVAALAVKKSLKTLLANPGLAIAAGIALTAVGVAMKNISTKGVRGFADGGIVSSPTLAMVGEGAGTRNSNPEIVAPLNKLKDIIGSQPNSLPTKIELFAQGGALRGTLDVYDKRFGRSF